MVSQNFDFASIKEEEETEDVKKIPKKKIVRKKSIKHKTRVKRQVKKASKSSGPFTGPFGSTSKGSYFGPNTKDTTKSKNSANEKILVESNTEILTADGLINADRLLNKNEEELKELGPFSAYDENGELIKYDILSAKTAVSNQFFWGA